MIKMLTIEPAAPDDAGHIQALYRECGYRGGVNEEDVVFVAQLRGRLVGAARLCWEADTVILRGMMVLPLFHRHGIGTQLLQACVQLLTLQKQDCYCIPWSHLSSFYAQAGFRHVTPEDAPAILRDRFLGYIAEGRSVLLMYRPEPA